MRIAILGIGQMGSAIGSVLVHNGARVFTHIEGRSVASRSRAREAGILEASLADVGSCDMVLSIVPPHAAREALDEVLPHLSRRTLYVDCNAVHPDTARELARAAEEAGALFADAGILGGPPSPDGKRNPLFLVSGSGSSELAALASYGIRIQEIGGAAGRASALKMALAGVSKGMTGILAQMIMLAGCEDVRQPFLEHLRQSQPALVAWGEAQFPQLHRKAGRWIEEVEILAELAAGVPGGELHFRGMKALYQAIAGNSDALTAEMDLAIA